MKRVQINMFFLLFVPLFFGITPLYSYESATEGIDLSLEEKIGQLFMVPLCSSREDSHVKDVYNLVKNYHIGGVIVETGSKREIAQSLEKLAFGSYPLLVAMDAEFGSGMRVKDGFSFPKNITLGALRDSSLVYAMGVEIARELKEIGINLNFSPVVDVLEGNYPLLISRSFGSDPDNVIAKAKALISGMQSEGVYACLKHFPGHGAANVDSHNELPKVVFTDNWKRVHLAPFSSLIKEKPACIMSGHLFCPFLSDRPASCSKEIIEGLLRNRLHYEGVVITDALNMGALEKDGGDDVAIRAFLAGNDILLYGDYRKEIVDDLLQNKIPSAIEALKEFLKKNPSMINALDEKVSRIIALKKRMASSRISSPFNKEQAEQIKSRIYASSLCVLGKKKAFSLLEIGKVSCEENVDSLKSSAETKSPSSEELLDACKSVGYIYVGKKKDNLLKNFFERQNIFCVEFSSRVFQEVEEINKVLSCADTYYVKIGKDVDIDIVKELLIKTLKDKRIKIILCDIKHLFFPHLKGYNTLVCFEEEKEVDEQVIRVLKGDLNPEGFFPIDNQFFP